MIEAAAVLAAVTLLAMAALAIGYMVTAHRTLVRRNVIVNTKTDESFRGVLWKIRGPLIVIRNAEIYAQGQTKPVDGEVVIDRSNVDFIQIVSGS